MTPVFFSGATRDIGACLTRIVMRHKSMESRMKSLAGALMDCLIIPVQGRLDEWRRVTAILDKDHRGHHRTWVARRILLVDRGIHEVHVWT